MTVRRRALLTGSLFGAGAVALGGSLWSCGRAAGRPDDRTYGVLGVADENGVALPPGFSSRVVARSGRTVGASAYRWHPAPDGGACFPDGRGWIYVSNSEVLDVGGAGAIRFAADGQIVAAYRILDGTDRNCAGGPTPWGTWLSCEEVDRGRVHETDPYGTNVAVAHPAMGRFNHEAAAVDPVRRVVYLTEDEPDGCFYRYRPSSWPDLALGVLEVMCHDAADGPLRWETVPDPAAADEFTRDQVPAARRFDGGEGAWYADGACWFTTKGDNSVWRYDAAESRLDLVYDDTATITTLTGPDNLTLFGGEVFVAEDGGNMQICTLVPGTGAVPFLQVLGHERSEMTGPAFTPDGSRLYFSSQRGTSGDGVTFEVTGPFRHTG